MQSLIRKTFVPLGALVLAAVFLLVLGFMAISGTTQASDNRPTYGHLVTIHDRGSEKVVHTNREGCGFDNTGSVVQGFRTTLAQFGSRFTSTTVTQCSKRTNHAHYRKH